jgi:hypothetical protein
VIVFTSTGKKQMAAASATFDVIPKPNHAMNTGASATLGVVWKRITIG